MNVDYSQEGPVVAGRLTLAQIEELVAKPMDTKPDKKYFIALSISLTALSIGAICLGLTFFYGVGLWGNNQPVGWAVDIVNFFFWVGIGHAGTLISAILFLLRQKWRTGIARFAEAMTIFAAVSYTHLDVYKRQEKDTSTYQKKKNGLELLMAAKVLKR